MSKPSPLTTIRSACQPLELAAQAERGLSPAALAERRPTKRAARDWEAWWRYHTFLSRTLAGGAFPADGGPSAAPQVDVGDALVFDALRSQPRVVRLTPDATGTRPTVTVYPKGGHALFELHAHNLLLAQYTAFVQEWQASTEPAAIDAVQRAVREIDYQNQRCAWVLTTSGPGLPYADDADAPEPPATIRDASPLDWAAIAREGADVNGRRLAGLDALMAADPTDGSPPRRPSWSSFFASIAPNPGDASRLMRDVALVELVATVRLGNDAKLAAHQDATRDAEARRGSA